MAFELLMCFESTDSLESARLKMSVLSWLEAKGRFDVVDGIIDGVDVLLTDDELATAKADDGRFATAPLAIFDDRKQACEDLLQELRQEFGSAVSGRITEILDDSWQNCWHESFEKFQSNKFFFVPLGSSLVTPADRIRVELISRGDEFGTGQHATTRAVVKVLEQLIQAGKPRSMLDVGTGTGVYLIVAGLMGLEELAATEISEDLVGLARENCDIAGVKADIRLADRPQFEKKYDLVVSNILVPVLHDIMGDMAQHLSPDGHLVLAGFIEKEEARLVQTAEANGLVMHDKISESGWNCLTFKLKD